MKGWKRDKDRGSEWWMVPCKEDPYCLDKENIAHLFFNCSSASLLWRIIYITFGLSRPNSVNHLFGSWLRGLTKSHKNLVYTGIAALCWAIWRSRNDIVFQKIKNQTSLQILFRTTYLTKSLDDSSQGGGQGGHCHCLPHARDGGNGFFFATNGWMFSNRLGL